MTGPQREDPAPGERREPARRPQSVLFACSFNAVRSPMAEALARSEFGKEIFFASAGVRSGELNGFAVAVMQEVGIDISGHVPRTFADLEDMNFDMIVSLSPEAHHTALEFTRTMALDAVYWPTMEPTAVAGSRETKLAAYREVRDVLKRKIGELLATR